MRPKKLFLRAHFEDCGRLTPFSLRCQKLFPLYSGRRLRGNVKAHPVDALYFIDYAV